MQNETDTKNTPRIVIIGKFKNLYDEEYIALAFEEIGCTVLRIEDKLLTHFVIEKIEAFKPDYVLWIKFTVTEPKKLREYLRKYKTICWVFDLYWGYEREYRLTTHPAFTADYVFTTDGGNDDRFKSIGINHVCIRQGIHKPDCFMYSPHPEDKIVFVGSENALHSARYKLLDFVSVNYKDKFKWYGRFNTNEVRGMGLNHLYASSKIVIGDSVYSPNYWSNRVVETLGRGGFLIHRHVPGIDKEYPYLVTYDGTFEDLKKKIDYYMEHEDERLEIVNKNHAWVRENYTMDKKCAELISKL